MPTATFANEAEVAYAAVVEEHGFGGDIPLRVCNRLAQRYEVPIEDMNRRLSRWPVEGINECIRASVLSQSDTLMSVRKIEGIKIALRQTMLYGGDFT